MKRLNFIGVCVFVIGTMVCCTSSDEYYKVDKKIIVDIPNAADTINGSLVARFDSTHHLVGMESIDSFVVVISEKSDSVINVLNFENGAMVSSFGSVGKADNDMITPLRECQLEKKDDGTLIMRFDDFCRHRIVSYDLSASMEKNQLVYVGDKEYQIFNQSEQFNYFDYIGDEYVAFQGIALDDNLTPFCVKSSDIENKCESYPKMIEGGESQKTFIYNIMAKIKPDKSKLLLVHGNIGLFTIVDLDSWSTLGIQERDSYDFEYLSEIANADSKQFFEKIRAYYTFLNVTDDYIILSRDGKHSMHEFDRMDTYQPMICFFDWTGNLIYSFVANEQFGYFTFNANNKCLYGIGKGNGIYKYDLSKVF